MNEEQQSKKEKPVDPIRRYQASGEELSYKELRTATWLVRNKILLGKIGTWCLLVFCIGTMGFSLYGWVKYFLFDYFDDRDLYAGQIAEIENYRTIQPLYSAQPLDIKRTDIFTVGEDLYDFVTQVVNPNERWIAHVTYRYTYSGTTSQEFEQLILPGQLQVLTAQGQESTVFPSQTKLEILHIDWMNVSAHRIKDVDAFMESRLNFVVDNTNFVRRNTGGAPTDQLSFTITNASAYSYWEPVFHVALFQSQSLVGLRTISVEQLKAGESTSVDLRFSGPPITISSVDIVPSIDIFDARVYIEPDSK